MNMKKQQGQSASSLTGLFHHRWAVPALAALSTLGGGAKFVTLQMNLGVSRDSLKRTLVALVDAGLIARNPGYGHPMRPEYVLTAVGKQVAPACAAVVEKLQRLGIEDIGLKKWSLPVAHALVAADGRFNRLCAALGEVTPRALAQALRDLQQVGLVKRLLVDDNPPRTEYQLTRRGRRLTSVMVELAQVT
jgi:DNA-binding HxlR family transcriptional regulator